MPESEEIEQDPVLRPYAELEDPGSLYISGIAVDAGWRGCGIGTALLEHAKSDARRRALNRISLICFEANEGALKLYLRHRFEVIERRAIVAHRDLHYSAGDALLMRLVNAS